MAYEKKPNQTALFKNDTKTETWHADYKGSVMVDEPGDYFVNLIRKTSSKGNVYLDLKLVKMKPKGEYQQSQKTNDANNVDDEIPF